MKILRIPLVIVLVVAVGRGFNANAQTETNLHSFVGSPHDGDYPEAGLVQGSDGNFYGTTLNGGTSTNPYCEFGCGTVFRISPSGSYTNLYSFDSSPNDGLEPEAGLVQGRDGNFYGTASDGGTYGNGTVFRISPSGIYTSLYSFGSQPNDGQLPVAGLLLGSDGNFYGTTAFGGTNDEGIVFRINPSGNEAIIYSFVGPPDGNYPWGLVQGSDGNLYGTTYGGGTNDVTNGGDGTVFRISLSGSYTNLYSFGSQPNDGQNPFAGLTQGSDGNLYGTTSDGGGGELNGTVFRISPSGIYTNLYSFGSQPDDGQNPNGLVQGSDGNFYGTATSSGAYGGGTVFRISPSGNYTNLYSFGSTPTDGETPFPAGLVQGSDGNFYGTTEAGGGATNSNPYSFGHGYGTVFKLTVSLNPPANQISQIKLVGTNVVFTIPSVAGETYQLQYRNSLTSGSWSNIPGVLATNSIGSILTLTNFAGANQPKGFFRFDITP